MLLNKIFDKFGLSDDAKKEINEEIETIIGQSAIKLRMQEFILANIPSMAFVTDREGRIFAYYGGEETYVSESVFMGKTFADVLPKDVGRSIYTNINNANNKGKSCATYSLIENTQTNHYQITTKKVSDDVFVHSVANITTIKNKEREIDRIKNEFLHNISHELRTPLNGIMGFAEILQTYPKAEPEEIASHAKVIYKSGQNLLEVINNIILFTQIRSGYEKVSISRFNLFLTINEVIETQSEFLQEKGLCVDFVYPEALEQIFESDCEKISKIISILVENAIKFTSVGKISIIVSKNNLGEYVIKIHDTGIGMSQKDMMALFTIMHQADGSMTRKFRGLGLGLCVASNLAKIIEAKIETESVLGEGSTFSVILPIVPIVSKEVSIKKEVKLEPQKIKILIVEDDFINANCYMRILGSEQYKINHMADGRLALKELEKEKYDIILMDCQMPNMDGFEATRKIREIEKETGEHVPIVAVTAGAFQEDKDECIKCGMDDYVSKPVNLHHLREVIEKLTKRRNKID